jgi:hypothetical protein
MATSVMAFAQVSCECEKIQCGTCEFENGLEFYTSPCGENGQRLKSCSKPRCEHVHTASLQCPDRNVAATAEATAANVAPRPQLERIQVTAGTVLLSTGEVSVYRAMNGTVKELTEIKAGFKILEHDVIETHEGRVKLVFVNRNELFLTPRTRLEIVRENFRPGLDQRNTTLNLLYGTIRNTVHQKYDGKDNTYEVHTAVAVAGVRGTDFFTSYHDDHDGVMKIQTLSGVVELGPVADEKTVSVHANQEGAYTVDAYELKSSSTPHGYFSAVQPMDSETIRALLKDTYVAPAESIRKPAETTTEVAKMAPEDPICSQPLGRMNQCAWACEGNPRGQKSCRLDQPQVKCVRRRCNANGQWNDEARTPASTAQLRCVSPTVQVGECDY